MKRSFALFLALTLTLFLLVVSCDDDDDNSYGKVQAVKEIGPAGGTLEVTDQSNELYGLKIEVPEEAVDQKIKLKVSQSDAMPTLSGFQSAGSSIHIEQEGDTELKRYATITMPYNERIIPPSIDERALMVYYYAGKDAKPKRLSRKNIEKIDTHNNLIVFKTLHFSWWDRVWGNPENLWDGRYDEQDSTHYCNGIDFLKDAKNAPELWNTILGDPTESIIDLNKLETMTEYVDLFELEEAYGDLNSEIEFYKCQEEVNGEQQSTKVMDFINDTISIGEFIDRDPEEDLPLSNFKKTGDNILFLMSVEDKISDMAGFMAGVGYHSTPYGITLTVLDKLWALGWDFFRGYEILVEQYKIENLYRDCRVTHLDDARELEGDELDKVNANNVDHRISSRNCSYAVWKESDNFQLANDLDILFGLYKFKPHEFDGIEEYPDQFYTREDHREGKPFYGFVLHLFDMLNLCSDSAPGWEWADLYPEVNGNCVSHADAFAVIRHGSTIKLEFFKNSEYGFLSYAENMVYRIPEGEECKETYVRFIAWGPRLDKPLYFSPWYKLTNSECEETDSENDSDGDGIPDESDNCPDTKNPEQQDSDGDGIGDKCDTNTKVTADFSSAPDSDSDWFSYGEFEYLGDELHILDGYQNDVEMNAAYGIKRSTDRNYREISASVKLSQSANNEDLSDQAINISINRYNEAGEDISLRMDLDAAFFDPDGIPTALAHVYRHDGDGPADELAKSELKELQYDAYYDMSVRIDENNLARFFLDGEQIFEWQLPGQYNDSSSAQVISWNPLYSDQNPGIDAFVKDLTVNYSGFWQ